MNTKNWFTTLLGAGVVVSGLALTSCEDEFTEADAIAAQDSTLIALKRLDNENAVAENELDAQQELAFRMYQDSLARVGPIVNYTVTVIAGGSVNTNGRTEAQNFAEGATLTLVQGGVSRTATAGVGGVASFSDLRIGEAVVTVSAPDHTTVTYTTSLGSATSAILQDNVETTIPLFPTTVAGGASEVSGIAWAERDLTNNEPEFAEGAIVRASISVSGALGDYNISIGGAKGQVASASYDNFVVVDTVGADGRYSLIIPNGNANSGNGLSGVVVDFLPYETQQTYLTLQGDSLTMVTEAVIFDPAAAGPIGNHIDTDLPSAWIEIGAPTGSASGFATSPRAIARALVTADAQLDRRGTGYTVGDRFNFSADTAGNDSYIEVTAVDADTEAITNFIVVTDGASDYTAKPSLTQDDAASGSGATFILVPLFDYEFEVTNQGSGYWDTPEIVVSFTQYDNGVLAQKSDLTGSLNNIALLNGTLRPNNVDGVVYTQSSATPPSITLRPLEARQAVIDFDDFLVNDQGELESNSSGDPEDIQFSGSDADAGAGYVTSPGITFRSLEGMGSGATGFAEVFGGEISRIVITNPGSGYMKEVNGNDYDINPTAIQNNTGEQFKPGSSNKNFNFDYGDGVIVE
ncbi:MAG: hypothetical protein AAF944_01835 [Bacteroidota bacterium]